MATSRNECPANNLLATAGKWAIKINVFKLSRFRTLSFWTWDTDCKGKASRPILCLCKNKNSKMRR